MFKGYDKFGEELQLETLANGLSVYFIPKKGFSKSYASLTVNYGGIDRRFKLGGKWTDTPAGIAHFLEHKMFDMPQGSALEKLASQGAEPNAFTAADITSYYFTSTDKFYDNLRTLLEYVSTPYFTAASVQKERNIIAQEIRMMEDDPNYALYYGMLDAMYQHDPIRYSVAGTVESISEITEQMLYDCHKIFYSPSNMVLCAAGDVNIDKIISACEQILPAGYIQPPVRAAYPAEDTAPGGKIVTKSMQVDRPLLCIGIPTEKASRGPEYLKKSCVASVALALIGGRTSNLYRELYAQGLINRSFSAGFDQCSGVAFSSFSGQSDNPNAVFERINQEIQLLSGNGVDEDAFNNIIKAQVGYFLRGLNFFSQVCYNFSSGHFSGYNPFEKYKILTEMNCDDVNSFIANDLKNRKMVMSVVEPIKSETGD